MSLATDLPSIAAYLRQSVRAGYSVSAALRPYADEGLGWVEMLRALRAAFALGIADAGAIGGWRTGTGEVSDEDLDALLGPEIEALRPRWDLDEAPVASAEAMLAPLQFAPPIPVLRLFDEAKAIEFYVDFLGFQIDWRHRFDDRAPLYLQLSRAGLILHLSEHHGDSCPGSTVLVPTSGLRSLQQELSARDYRYAPPQIERTPWGTDVMELTDPFGNRLRFSEQVEDASAS